MSRMLANHIARKTAKYG